MIDWLLSILVGPVSPDTDSTGDYDTGTDGDGPH